VKKKRNLAKGLAILILAIVMLSTFVLNVPSRANQMEQDDDLPISESTFPADFPMREAENLAVDEYAEKTKEIGELILPTWMPKNMELRNIYFLGSAILVYSDQDTRDYRADNITIQISKSTLSPTYETLGKYTSGEVVKIGEMNIVILENAAPDHWMEQRGQRPILIYFWYKGFYYIITGIEGQVTKEDMINITANMEPVGPRTLRGS